MSCILSGMGFVYFFGRLDPRVKQQDAPCQFPNSFFFIFLLFSVLCVWKRILFLKKLLGKTHSHKKQGSCRAKKSTLFSSVLVFASLFKENMWVVLLPPPSLITSALLLSSWLWCLSGAAWSVRSFGGDAFSPSFGWCCFLALPLLGRCCISHPFLVWCCLGLLSGCFLPSGSLFFEWCCFNGVNWRVFHYPFFLDKCSGALSFLKKASVARPSRSEKYKVLRSKL